MFRQHSAVVGRAVERGSGWRFVIVGCRRFGRKIRVGRQGKSFQYRYHDVSPQPIAKKGVAAETFAVSLGNRQYTVFSRFATTAHIQKVVAQVILPERVTSRFFANQTDLILCPPYCKICSHSASVRRPRETGAGGVRFFKGRRLRCLHGYDEHLFASSVFFDAAACLHHAEPG